MYVMVKGFVTQKRKFCEQFCEIPVGEMLCQMFGKILHVFDGVADPPYVMSAMVEPIFDRSWFWG